MSNQSRGNRYSNDFKQQIYESFDEIFFTIDIDKMLILESETINGIYARAYFTKREIKHMEHFRKEYDEKEFVTLGPVLTMISELLEEQP